jgi:hypothetical protein
MQTKVHYSLYLVFTNANWLIQNSIHIEEAVPKINLKQLIFDSTESHAEHNRSSV